MKTKQKNMIAKIVNLVSNGKNYSGDKEQIHYYLVIDKKTERRVVACRCWMGRSASAQTVYAGLWVNSLDHTISAAGHGAAGGSGYHKSSAAIEEAIARAGIELYGSPYYGVGQKIDMKKRAYIGGVGDTAVESALLAIAYALGCKDGIFVSA